MGTERRWKIRFARFQIIFTIQRKQEVKGFDISPKTVAVKSACNAALLKSQPLTLGGYFLFTLE